MKKFSEILDHGSSRGTAVTPNGVGHNRLVGEDFQFDFSHDSTCKWPGMPTDPFQSEGWCGNDGFGNTQPIASHNSPTKGKRK